MPSVRPRLRSKPPVLLATLLLIALASGCSSHLPSAGERGPTAAPFPSPAPKPISSPPPPPPPPIRPGASAPSDNGEETYPPSPVLEPRAGPKERPVIYVRDHSGGKAAHSTKNTDVALAEETPPEEDLKQYSVIAATDPLITNAVPLHKLTVWIGSQAKSVEKQKTFAAGLSVAETSFASPTSSSARITPKSTIPGIKFDPATVCSRIDLKGNGTSKDFYWQLPSGTPNAEFEVGAEVRLFSATDCTGPATDNDPKSVAVKVALKTESAFSQFLKQLLSTTEKGFFDFWGKFVALFFALLLFLVRKKFFAWFGFKQDKEADKTDKKE
jgi:hypothetical protein